MFGTLGGDVGERTGESPRDPTERGSRRGHVEVLRVCDGRDRDTPTLVSSSRPTGTKDDDHVAYDV